MIEITIHDLPKIITNGSKGSWKAAWAEARKWHRLVQEALILTQQVPEKPFKTAKLTLTRFSSNQPDFDNLAASFKHVVDGLVKAQVLENDKIDNIGYPDVAWTKCKRGEGKIIVKIEF